VSIKSLKAVKGKPSARKMGKIPFRKNPYLQYFLGFSSYSNEAPFEASMLVHFRERISHEAIDKINRQLVKRQRESQGEESPVKKLEVEATGQEKNRGKLKKKPRTYRKLARKSYLEVAKQRKPKAKQRKKALRKQLQYIKRNLAHLDKLLEEGASLETLSKRDYKLLLVITEVVRQQLWMYENKKQGIENRIVSLTQPHICPLVRGKAGTAVEFGAKFSASCFDGYVFLDHNRGAIEPRP
jgi:hypothetical protein